MNGQAQSALAQDHGEAVKALLSRALELRTNAVTDIRYNTNLTDTFYKGHHLRDGNSDRADWQLKLLRDENYPRDDVA